MKRLPLIDIAQFIAALLVIMIHCGRLAESEVVHFILKSGIARMAVPFFFVANGYFYREKQRNDSHYSRKYFQRQLRVYFLWSLFYLPYGLKIMSEQNIPVYMYPLALVIACAYLGVCYHLWYFPALFTGILWSRWLTKRYAYPTLFAFSGILFLLGSSETYNACLPKGLGLIYEQYRNLFFTTRNGLFFGLIFVLMGFFISDNPQHPILIKKNAIKLGISLFFLAIEGGFIFYHQGIDKNFFLSLIPVIPLLFTLLRKECELKDTKKWKEYSNGLFFLHPFFLESIRKITSMLDASLTGLQLFFLTAVITMSFLFIKTKYIYLVGKNAPQRKSRRKAFKKSIRL